MAIEIETIVPGAPRLGEGAVWDDADQLLWWVDITGGVIHRFDPDNTKTASFDFGEPVGCVARRQKGGLVVAAKSGFWLFDPDTGERQHISDPEADKPSHRFNDGSVDHAGRFWAGTMRDDGQPEKVGQFYQLDTNLEVRAMNHLAYTTNGTAFSPDGSIMYFSDSNIRVQTIWSCDYDVATGEHGPAHQFFDAHGVAGRPDGGTVDAEGYYWMAGINGWQIYRISPKGEVVMTIDLPVEKPTKPMFGGKNLDVLYVTSIGFGLTEGTAANQPDAGGLLAITGLGIKGLAQPRFQG